MTTRALIYTAMADEWFVRVQGKTYGPVDAATLREWRREGRLIPENEIRAGADGEWQIAGTMQEFFPAVAPRQEGFVRLRTWPELIREAFAVYRRGFWQLLLMALLTAVPSFFLQELVPFTLPTLTGVKPSFPHVHPGAIALLVVLIAVWPISAAGLQLSADGVVHNERPPLSKLLRNAVALWPRMLLLGLVVYGCYFFWLIIPFSAMLSLVSGEPTVVSLLLFLAIAAFTVYMNARLFINFLFWQQTAALSGAAGMEALRESKRLARSRPGEAPLQRPLYRGAIIASVWLLALIVLTAAAQVPFTAARLIGVTDPAQAMELAQKLATNPPQDALATAGNLVAALLHLLLRPLLATSFVVLYHDARARQERG